MLSDTNCFREWCFFRTIRNNSAEAGGPGGRIGHSMVLAGNDSRVIMFGGRDNEIVRQHIPKTYEVGLANSQRHKKNVRANMYRYAASSWIYFSTCFVLAGS